MMIKKLFLSRWHFSKELTDEESLAIFQSQKRKYLSMTYMVRIQNN